MNRKVRNLLASVVFGVCLLALSFIPSFAANSANPASVGNVEAMKENVVYDFQSLSFADAPDYVKGIKSVSVDIRRIPNEEIPNLFESSHYFVMPY